MTLRPIQTADLPGLLTLCRDHAAYEGLNFSESDQIGRWQQAFFGPSPRLFGWVIEGTPLQGYMTATIDFATWDARPFVYLDCLYLRPEARRSGLGRRLMTVLSHFAKAQGCAEIQWQTPPSNADGIAFYRALAARELPKQRFALSVVPVAEDAQ
jgi:ribosomal protein S18 acetylase RimI-like enzyme